VNWPGEISEMQFLCNPENITPRLKYSVDFIFNTQGFNIEIISSKKLIKSNDLIIGYMNKKELEPFNNLDLINIPNFNELYQLENFEKQVDLIKVNNENIPIFGTSVKSELNNKWEKSKKENYYYSTFSKIWQIEYDIITNIFYHLSRFEERWRLSADEKKSDWTKSVLSRANNLQIPVVDVLLNEFKNIIYSKSKKAKVPIVRILPWPSGEKFAVSFTHDIDLIRGYSVKEYLIFKTKSALFTILKKPVKKQEVEKNLKDKNMTVWSFTKIQDFYKKKNWRATFFFLAKMLEGRHFRYNITSKKFNKLFKELKANGHEIALHPSLKSFDNPEKYANEKLHLEKNADIEIQGMRQHYLRFKVPRIWNLTQMTRLKYDSSLGYNFQPGFRAGTSNCFTTFDYKENKHLNVIEFPITFFEYNLAENDRDKNQSSKIIEDLVKQVEKNEGTLNVLIHPSNFLISPYLDYWQVLIKKIERKNIFVTTLSGFTEWFQNKKAINITYYSDAKEMILNIKKPRLLRSFSFEMSKKGEFDQTEKVLIKKTGVTKYFCQSIKSKFTLTYKLS
jgi:hypothetical protein